jgi:hypothetical protein
MAEDEIDVLIGTEIGQPVPGEHALAADHETLTIRFDQSQEGIGLGGDVLVENDLTSGIKDTDVHGIGMEIDTAIKLMLFGVKSHGAGSFL